MYDLMEHRHRFSVWAAARAAQRKWPGAKVTRLRAAIEASDLVEYVRENSNADIDEAAYSALHTCWCSQIISNLGKHGIDCTFGRAAKLTSVYLKCMVVCHEPGTCLARVCHPPIDRILLQTLARQPGADRLRKLLPWTKLDQNQYYELIGLLREFVEPDEPFWMLERFWNVSDDGE